MNTTNLWPFFYGCGTVALCYLAQNLTGFRGRQYEHVYMFFRHKPEYQHPDVMCAVEDVFSARARIVTVLVINIAISFGAESAVLELAALVCQALILMLVTRVNHRRYAADVEYCCNVIVPTTPCPITEHVFHPTRSRPAVSEEGHSRPVLTLVAGTNTEDDQAAA